MRLRLCKVNFILKFEPFFFFEFPEANVLNLRGSNVKCNNGCKRLDLIAVAY